MILGFSSRSDGGKQPRRSPVRINEIYIFPTARRLPPGSAAGRLDILRYTYESRRTHFWLHICTRRCYNACMWCLFFLYPNLPQLRYSPGLFTGTVRSALPPSSLQRNSPKCCFNGSFLSAFFQWNVPLELHREFTQRGYAWNLQLEDI